MTALKERVHKEVSALKFAKRLYKKGFKKYTNIDRSEWELKVNLALFQLWYG